MSTRPERRFPPARREALSASHKIFRPAPITQDVIRLHRLGHTDAPFHLNPDLILTVEAHPDTVVTLTTGTKVLIAEAPEDVIAAVREWRSSILTASLPSGPRRRRPSGLALVRGTVGDGVAAVLAQHEEDRS